jgi:hypothetical protein
MDELRKRAAARPARSRLVHSEYPGKVSRRFHICLKADARGSGWSSNSAREGSARGAGLSLVAIVGRCTCCALRPRARDGV